MSGRADVQGAFRFLKGLAFFCVLLMVKEPSAFGEEGVFVDRNTVIRSALSSHPLVSIALARTKSQHEKIGTARSDYYPHLTLSLDQLFLNTAFIGGVFPNFEPIAPEMLNPSLTQNITTFGGRHFRVKAERLLLESRQEDLDEARLSVVYRANIAYDQLAMFEHLFHAAQKNEEDAALHYRLAQERLVRGLGVITDVTMSRLLLEKTRLERVTEANALRKAQADLVYAMGQESMVPYRTAGSPHPPPPAWSLQQMIDYALRHRPLLLSELARDREKSTRIEEVRTRNYPNLSFFAQGFILWGVPPTISGAPAGSGLFLPTFQSGLALSVPIFVGGEILHETQRARMEAVQESEKTRLVRIQIIRNVRKLYDDLQTQLQTLALDQAGYDNAIQNERLVEKRFSRGLVDGVTAIDAETEVLTTRERLIADRFRLSMIQDGLDREIGLKVGF